MNRLNRDCYVVDFCTAWPGAEAVQVTAIDGDLVRDVAEFRLADWGQDRPDGVLEWLETAPAGDLLAPGGPAPDGGALRGRRRLGAARGHGAPGRVPPEGLMRAS